MPQSVACPGPKVYSDFRQDELAKRLGVKNLDACYFHLIAFHDTFGDEVPSGVDLDALQKLLFDGDVSSMSEGSMDPSTYTFYVVPRTLSPWSSKATNIAQVCGFGKWIKRIERISIVKIMSHRGFDEKLASDLLHDRMTQIFLKEWPDSDQLFADPLPTPAKAIDLDVPGLGPHEALQAANKELGLALDESEIDYLVEAYSKGGPVPRNPYDVELFMFAQVSQSALLTGSNWY